VPVEQLTAGSAPERALPVIRPIAVVIPAWDEAESIGAVLSEVPPDLVSSVFVICRGGQDATYQIAAAHGARALRPLTPGYGAACWQGTGAAAADGARIIAFLDGDYSDPPGDLPRVLAPIVAGEADLVLGCRGMSVRAGILPLHARLGNELVSRLLGYLLGQRLHDLPSFKAIRLDCLAQLQMSEMTYGWTTELVTKAVRAGLRIEEVTIQYRPRLGGKSKVSGTVRGTLGAAWKLCTCAIRYARWHPGTIRTSSPPRIAP
jgi:Glycosyl transferase family 2